ncbi:MAG: exodeoxyribonuclease V subunit alpha [Myxococcota bacterium]
MSGETQNISAFREQGVLRALDVHLAKTLGRITKVSDPLVLLGAASASRAQGAGHVCLDLGGFQGQVRDEAVDPKEVDWPEAELWAAKLRGCEALVRGPDEQRRTPLILEGEHLYLDRYWAYQTRLATQVVERLGGPPHPIDEDWLDTTLDRLFPPGKDKKELQKLAAKMAVMSRFTIITGGPGTGKTTTIKRLMALLIEDARRRGDRDPRFVLMAPTGKAAARMKESIQARETHVPLKTTEDVIAAFPTTSSTIHRALGWTPKHRTRFKRNAESPLAADVIIVDEASMIDLAMMTKLFEAVPQDARLILLGDSDQLKSIESGAVLGDLVAGLAPRQTGVVKLEYTHRFGKTSGVGALSRAINRASLSDVQAFLTRKASEDPTIAAYDTLTWLPLDAQESLPRLKQRITAHLKGRILEAMKGFREAVDKADWGVALKALDSFRVLAAHRRGPLGVQGLNRSIEKWLSKAYDFSTKDEHYLGRPILVTENDKDLELYNGDVGFIGNDSQGRRVGIFPETEGYRQVPVARLPPHETVYAMTIHKSQGSQFNHALVALPVTPSRIITRELLYTAVTRAAHLVTIIGSEASLETAVGQPVSRSSGLPAALARLP